MENEFKELLKKELIKSLRDEKEIMKIILFGSFLKSDRPNDADIAIFQNSDEPYLALAMKYRRLTRKISKKIPLDIIPVKSDVKESSFLSEIESGEVIYEA